MKIILLGAPGAGKCTQAKNIEKELHLAHISTGDMLREEIKSGSALGLELKETINKGHLASDTLIANIVKERVAKDDCKNGFLLDGIPRTLAQAEDLIKMGIEIDYIVEIQVDDNAILERITGRRIHEASGRSYHVTFNPPKTAGKDDITGEELIIRHDDNTKTVKNRLTTYHSQTAPLIGFYKNLKSDKVKRPQHIIIDGNKSPNEVTSEIIAKLK